MASMASMANYSAFNPKHLFKIGQSKADGVTYTRFVYENNTVVMAKEDVVADAVEAADATSASDAVDSTRSSDAERSAPVATATTPTATATTPVATATTPVDTTPVATADEHRHDQSADHSPLDASGNIDQEEILSPLLTISPLGDTPLSYTAMREMAGAFGMGTDVDITRIGDVFFIEKAESVDTQVGDWDQAG